MKIPFTTEQFIGVFRDYNESVFPFQILLYVFAFVAIILAISRNPYASGAISLILSFLWIWMGIAYHLVFFTSINKAAYLFGPLFITQGLLFFYHGTLKSRFYFDVRFDFYNVTGILLLLYSLVGYPLIGYYYGHTYPQSPTFGLPCPTTIFTFGLLIMNTKKTPLSIVTIPLIWSVIGLSAAISLGFIEDTGLIVAAMLTLLALTLKNNSVKKETKQSKINLAGCSSLFIMFSTML